MTPPTSTPPPEQKLFGLVTRKPRWGLSWRGRLAALGLFIAAVVAFWLGAYDFFAITEKTQSRILVVEGWIPTGTLGNVAKVCLEGNFETVLVVRGLRNVDNIYESGRYSGDYVAQTIVNHGLPRAKVETLFFPVALQDRTYHAGLIVKHWLQDHAPTTTALNVITVGPHARRSRLLYEKALGDGVRVGIISALPVDYDPGTWWKSSAGVRDVVGETIAYFYARFLFRREDDLSAAEGANPAP